MIDRKGRAPARGSAQGTRAIADRLDRAQPDELVALIARANAALPDTDSRKIRPADVAMLRRLAGQARLDSSTAADAADGTQRAERLAAALESIIATPELPAAQPDIPRRAARAKPRVPGPDHESLAHQTREFRAADGSAWRVRIEQGGGKAAVASDDPPVAALIFRRANDEAEGELSAAEPGGKWDLSSYTDAELQAVLDRARA